MGKPLWGLADDRYTWEQPWAQGGRPGHKTGLAFCKYDETSLPGEMKKQLPAGGQFGSLRANDTMRIYGKRIENTFHVVWFDRNKKLYP